MKKINWVILLACLFGFVFNSYAQSLKKGTVQGKITSLANNHSELEGAIISVLHLQDSVVVGNALADRDGLFEIKGLAFGKYKIITSLFGYKTASNFFSVSVDKPVHKMNITLDSSTIMLKEIEVVAEAPPIKLKKDTIEFNASSFKTRENAVVEDLLKKLPGVEVLADGTITAYGQKITGILVDGKPFFGDDPKVALQNLPAFIINKVQVIDKKSKQVELLNEEDGKKEVMINLTIKKDKKKGLFGNASIGTGNDNRYDAALNLNRFNNDQQMNWILNSKRNFLSSSLTGGVNYSETWGKKVNFSGSYSYINSSTDNEIKLKRNNIVQDQSIFYFDNSNSGNGNRKHLINFNIEYQIDSTSTLRVKPAFNFQKNNSYTTSQFESTNSELAKINDGNKQSNSSAATPSFSNTITYNKFFKKKGRAISVNVRNNFDGSLADDYNNSISSFYQSEFVQNSINQKNLQEKSSNNNSFQVNYSEPIPLLKNTQFMVGYQYSNRIENSSRNTFDFNEVTNEYDLMNAQMSNNYRNHTIFNQYGFDIKGGQEKYYYSLGISLKQNDLKGKSLTRDSLYRQKTSSFIPRANFGFNFSRRQQLSFSYSGSLRQPSITDLQPVPDNSNPLYVRIGNPNLKPEFSNNLNINYNFFTASNMSVFTSISGSTAANRITYNSFFDLATGKQTSRPENISGNYNLDGNFSFGMPIKSLKATARSKLLGRISRNITFINGERVATNNYNYGGGLSFDFYVKEIVDLSIASNLQYNQTNYAASAVSDVGYLTAGSSLTIRYYLPKNFGVTSTMNYNNNTGRIQGASREMTMLDAGIYKEFLKNRQARLSLQGFDLLNQNSSISRTVKENLVEDRETRVLQRYFLLSFTYRLNKFGGKDSNVKFEETQTIVND